MWIFGFFKEKKIKVFLREKKSQFFFFDNENISARYLSNLYATLAAEL